MLCYREPPAIANKLRLRSPVLVGQVLEHNIPAYPALLAFRAQLLQGLPFDLLDPLLCDTEFGSDRLEGRGHSGFARVF